MPINKTVETVLGLVAVKDTITDFSGSNKSCMRAYIALNSSTLYTDLHEIPRVFGEAMKQWP